MAANDVKLAPDEGAANDDTTSTDDLEGRARALKLFESELGLVDVVARRVCRAVGGRDHLDDLVASGREGLFDAARRFDPSRGVPFKLYANVRIQGAMIDFVRSAKLSRRAYERLKTLEVATVATAGLADYSFFNAQNTRSDPSDLEDILFEQVASMTTAMAVASSVSVAAGSTGFEGEPVSDPEDAAARAEMVQAVRRALTNLDADELAIVKMTFFEDMNLREAATQLGMNKSWAFRVKARALEQLTKVLWPLRAEAGF